MTGAVQYATGKRKCAIARTWVSPGALPVTRPVAGSTLATTSFSTCHVMTSVRLCAPPQLASATDALNP